MEFSKDKKISSAFWNEVGVFCEQECFVTGTILSPADQARDPQFKISHAEKIGESEKVHGGKGILQLTWLKSVSAMYLRWIFWATPCLQGFEYLFATFWEILV